MKRVERLIRSFYRSECPLSRGFADRKPPVLVLCVLSIAILGCQRPTAANVVAIVNGEPIGRSEFDRLFKTQWRDGTQSQMESQERADTSRLAVLHDLIDQTILQQRAARLKLTPTDEDIGARFLSIREQYSDAEFNQLLRESNQTVEDLRRDVRRYLTLDRLLNKEINSKILVTDADVERYFNAHQARYNLTENQYRIAQISVLGPHGQTAFALPGEGSRSDAEAKKRIKMLKSRLTAGEDFGTVAIRYSEDQFAKNGGDAGFFSESQLRSDSVVYEAVTKLKVGQLSNILRVSPTGLTEPISYKILKLIARDAAGHRSLDSLVHQEIHDEIRNERSQLLQIAYLQTLRNESKVENHLAEEIFIKYAGSSISLNQK